MKRSQFNASIREAEAFFARMNFHLPPWASRSPSDWDPSDRDESEIVDNMLGWDITDFNSGDFARCGLFLFTLRNGSLGPEGETGPQRKPYAEKIMIVEESQETPLHFHWKKMEDIINRGGGNLVIQLYGSTEDEKLSKGKVEVRVDGIMRVLAAGDEVVLGPGQSICLTRGIYHRFYGEPGAGKVLVGEVSCVNDDNADNRFLVPAGRFTKLEEDEAPYRLLVSDYATYLRPARGD
jgi:D-lyxose ketol-isomerase